MAHEEICPGLRPNPTFMPGIKASSPPYTHPYQALPTGIVILEPYTGEGQPWNNVQFRGVWIRPMPMPTIAQNSAAWPEKQRLNRFGGSIQDSHSLKWGVMEEKTGGEMKGIPCP